MMKRRKFITMLGGVAGAPFLHLPHGVSLSSDCGRPALCPSAQCLSADPKSYRTTSGEHHEPT
jgi:hypothetical protein